MAAGCPWRASPFKDFVGFSGGAVREGAQNGGSILGVFKRASLLTAKHRDGPGEERRAAGGLLPSRHSCQLPEAEEAAPGA